MKKASKKASQSGMAISPKYRFETKGHTVVFGGSGEIGREIVRALVAHGVRSISFTYYRGKKVADALAAELKRKRIQVYYAQLDPADDGAARAFLGAAVNAVREEIKNAVNAVGWSPDTPFAKQTAALYEEVYRINTVGSVISMRAALDRMREHNIAGAAVLVTSSNGHDSWSSFSLPYDLSKSAQSHPLVAALAQEYAPSIRVNGVSPGWIHTKMNDSVPPEEMKMELAKIFMGRLGKPEEVAKLTVFLLGSGASFITGENYEIDGGYR